MRVTCGERRRRSSISGGSLDESLDPGGYVSIGETHVVRWTYTKQGAEQALARRRSLRERTRRARFTRGIIVVHPGGVHDPRAVFVCRAVGENFYILPKVLFFRKFFDEGTLFLDDVELSDEWLSSASTTTGAPRKEREGSGSSRRLNFSRRRGAEIMASREREGVVVKRCIPDIPRGIFLEKQPFLLTSRLSDSDLLTGFSCLYAL